MNPENPYILSAERVLPPPVSFAGRLRYLGPSLILTASIVGSGELIGTTLFGARAGFICFWVIILSCLVKVALQLEFGKYAIYTGRSTMAALNSLPGPKLGPCRWPILVWLAVMCAKLLQVGGIVGGVALIGHLAFPAVPEFAWIVLAVGVTGMLVSRGYAAIEKGSLILTVSFTVLTLISLMALQWTDKAVTFPELASGFGFRLPHEVAVYAWAAFALTGIGGDEILVYNYWLIEKGYAARTGPNDGSPEWAERARGWIRVMTLDALLSMGIYTLVTAVFYLLGAAILHRSGELPADKDLIERLALLYTSAFGPWGRVIYLAGGFAVLYSTMVAATGAWARQFADAAGQFGIINFLDPAQRNRAVNFCIWLFPCLWAIVYLVVRNSALMVVIGGIATMAVLMVVIFAASWFRLRQLPASLKPSRLYDAALVISILAIAAVAAQSLVNAILKMR